MNNPKAPHRRLRRHSASAHLGLSCNLAQNLLGAIVPVHLPQRADANRNFHSLALCRHAILLMAKVGYGDSNEQVEAIFGGINQLDKMLNEV